MEAPLWSTTQTFLLVSALAQLGLFIYAVTMTSLTSVITLGLLFFGILPDWDSLAYVMLCSLAISILVSPLRQATEVLVDRAIFKPQSLMSG